MNSDPVTIDGTLYPDGTVRLDQVPNVLSTGIAARQRGLAQVIDEIREGQRLRGFQGRTAEEIDGALREGEAYEQRMTSL